jgi:hypothetical protein
MLCQGSLVEKSDGGGKSPEAAKIEHPKQSQKS